MKKIKKGLCALSMAICGGAAFTVPLFAGCSGPNKKALEESGYELVSVEGGLSDGYYQNDNFSLEGKKMTIRDRATNMTYDIVLSDSMLLSRPDMTTGGEKEISVTYDGNTYSFVINVKEKSQKELLEQLKSIMKKYSAENFKDVSVQIDANYTARFLNEQANQTVSTGLIKPINEINKIETEELAKKLMKEFVGAVVDGVVRSSLEADGESINDAAHNQISVDYLSFLVNTYAASMDQPNLSYLINTITSGAFASEKVVDLIKNNEFEFLINLDFATRLVQYSFIMKNQENSSQYLKDSYGALKEYFDVLQTGSVEELAKFVSKQTNNDVYKQNLAQYGTPYFFYELQKHAYEFMKESLIQYNAGEDSLSNVLQDMESVSMAQLELAKVVDEIIGFNGNIGEYVLNAVKRYASALHDIDFVSQEMQMGKAYAELLFAIFNKDYSNAVEFVQGLLKEEALSELFYDVIPITLAQTINNYVATLSDINEDYLDISTDEMKNIIRNSLDGIRQNASLESFDFFENLANLMMQHFQGYGPWVNEVISYGQALDEMIKTGDFESLLSERAKLLEAISSVDVVDASKEIKAVLELEAILMKAADLLAFNNIESVTSFVVSLMNNETVGEDFTYYLKYGITSAMIGNTDSEDSYFQEIFDIVSPVIDKVKTDGNFSNFNLMEQYYEQEIASSSYTPDEMKDATHNFLVAIDNLIAGKSEKPIEDVLIAFAELCKASAMMNIDSWNDYYDRYGDTLDQHSLDYYEQQIIGNYALRTSAILGIRINEFINNQTPSGLNTMLNNIFVDSFNYPDEVNNKFNTFFVQPFVNSITVEDQIDMSQFDLHETVNMFMNFVDEIVGQTYPEVFRTVLSRFSDINNPDYVQNLLTIENITDVLTLATNSENRFKMFDFFAKYLYQIAGNGRLGEEAFVRNVEDILSDIHDGIANENLDVEETFKTIQRFADNNLIDEARITVYSLAAVYLIGTKPDLDYNEIFKFIELPQGVTVDYNKLIQKLSDESALEDMFKISNIETKLITSQDNLVEEIVEITLRVDCDVAIASIGGDIVLRMNIR